VLFHLLTGRPPFHADGVGAMIAAHLKEPAPRPSAVRSHIPVAIDPLVARCLAKPPEDRFQSMAELQQACEIVLAQLPPDMPTMTAVDPAYPVIARADATTTLGTSVGESALNARPRKLGLWIGVSAAAVAAGVVLAVMTTRPSASESPPADRPALFVPASSQPPPSEPVEAPAKPEPVKAEPVKTEPAKAEPVKTEPVKTEEPQAPDPKPEPIKKTKPLPKPKPPKIKPGGGVYDWD
jgi:serine/threonine-protein kinase